MLRRVHREVAPNGRCRLMCGWGLLLVRLCSVRIATSIMDPDKKESATREPEFAMLCENRETLGERNNRERRYRRRELGEGDDDSVQGRECA